MMTTAIESITLIEYLRDHRFIGEQCWADAAETRRDHDGYECPHEILEYWLWEWAMRWVAPEKGYDIIVNTYFQIRRLAGAYWTTKYGEDRPSEAAVSTFIDTAIDDSRNVPL